MFSQREAADVPRLSKDDALFVRQEGSKSVDDEAPLLRPRALRVRVAVLLLMLQKRRERLMNDGWLRLPAVSTVYPLGKRRCKIQEEALLKLLVLCLFDDNSKSVCPAGVFFIIPEWRLNLPLGQ